MGKVAWKQYSSSEKDIILRCISENPTNLTAAFHCASALMTNRKPLSVSNHWYSVLRHEGSAAFFTKSKVSTTPNTKNTRSPKKAYSYVSKSKPTTLSVSKGKLDLGGGKFIMGDFTITL